MELNQNARFEHHGYSVETTMKKVFVYADKKHKNLIGMAGVTRARDFDFDTLFKCALHKSGSKIQVA